MDARRVDRGLEVLTLLVILVVVAAFALMAIRWPGESEGRLRPVQDLGDLEISLDGAALRGSRLAPLVMIAYSDFSCSFCRTFANDTLPLLITKFVDTGLVLLAFRHLPPAVHGLSGEAAQVAVCAHEQGYFWELHDRFFSRGGPLSESLIKALRDSLPLDASRLEACMAGPAAERVVADRTTGISFGLGSTPSFQFGFLQADGSARLFKSFSGARSLEDFSVVLNGLLADRRELIGAAANVR
jgi:protein-disulfide isomerase